MPKIIVRSPSDGEVDLAAEIASKAFTGLSLEHWLESFHTVAEMFGNRFILIAELDGEPVSSLLCSPAPVYIDSTPVPHSGVGAVGTLPESRRAGCAGAMMAECVRVLRAEGIYLSSLWPFSYPYYRKFGWEVGAEFRSYAAQGTFFAGNGDAGRARRGIPEDAEAIKLAFDAIAPSFNGLTQRYDEWWKRVVKLPRYLGTDFPDHGAVVCEDPQGIASYMLYEVDRREDKVSVEVKESIFAENEHRRDILAVIGAEFPESDITFYASADDLYLHEIANPRGVRAGVHPSFQFRIIDPEKAMGSLPMMSHADGKITLSIHDPVFRQGFEFGVETRDQELHVCKPDSGRALEMDVTTLAKLYSGYLNPLDAYLLGKIRPRGDHRDVVAACQFFSCGVPYRTWLEPG